MHTVQCPHCRRKFKVPEPVVGARMRCSRCGQAFVGSSAQTPDTSRPDVPPAPEQAAARPAPGLPQKRHKTSNTSVILLAGGIFAVLGIIAMLIAIYYIRTHPTVEERDAKTGQLISRRTRTMTEAERRAAEIRRGAIEERRRRLGLPPIENGDDRPGPQGTQGDPKLEASCMIVRGAAVGDVAYACGRVLSKYAVPLKQVTVTAYISGRRGPSKTYQFVPAEGTIPYSIRLGNGQIDEDSVKVLAKGEPADKDIIVWAINPDLLEHRLHNEKVIWTGRTRNDSSVPVKDVRIYCDFFDNEGIHGGKAVGELEGARTIGVGKSASFRVEFDIPGAEAYETVVARAVGRKY